MSFLASPIDYINPKFILNLNDILFLMIVCFYLGRMYECRKWGMFGVIRNIQYGNISEQNQNSTHNQLYSNNQQVESQLTTQLIQNERKIIIKNNSRLVQHQDKTDIQPISIQEQNINKNLNHTVSYNAKKEHKSRKTSNCLQIIENQNIEMPQIVPKTSHQIKNNQKQNAFKNQNPSQNQFLLEKLKLEGQKIQQRGKFELMFEKNKNNENLIRKIQKHQIITDYFLKKEFSSSNYGQLVTLKSSIPNQNSVVEVEYFKNYQSSGPAMPIIQKRIYQLSQKQDSTFNLFFEHGKFRKLYRSINKIGQGGFGIVYEAYNMIECKKYAIKKIFMNKNSKQIQNLLNQIKILNNLSFPNIVNYNTCWLQYAQLNEHTSYKKLLEQMAQRKETQKEDFKGTSIKLLHNYQQHNNQEQQNEEYEQSYISSSKNSGFSFARSSKQGTKQSVKFKRRQSQQLAIKDLSQQKSPVITTTSSSFGLLPVMYIQMQLCEHSLSYYIRKRQTIDRVFAFQIMNQLVSGVSYIHTNRVVHRDLKPQNVLFVANNGQIVVKIGDFGLAINFGAKEQQGKQKYTIPNMRVGTPSYIAPQLYNESIKKLTEDDLQKADTYSLAVIYYQMLNKFTTTHERGQKLSLLKQGKVVGINQYKEEKKFIQQLIKHNRPKAKDITKLATFVKLQQTIMHIKKRAFRQKKIQKKQSVSTNNTSSMSITTDEWKSGTKQNSNSNKKEKQKNINKNRNRSKRTIRETQQKQQLYEYSNCNKSEQDQSIYGSRIIYRESEESHHQSNDELEKQNSDQINIELYKDNIELIKRVSSSQLKDNEKNGKNGDNKMKKNKNTTKIKSKFKGKQVNRKVSEQSNQSSESQQEILSKSIIFDHNGIKIKQ